MQYLCSRLTQKNCAVHLRYIFVTISFKIVIYLFLDMIQIRTIDMNQISIFRVTYSD